MSNRLKRIRLFLLIVLIASLVINLIFAFFHFQTLSSNTNVKASDTVYCEDIISTLHSRLDCVITFSSSKPSYIPGERAIFYIDILNFREIPISRVDFSLTVKALSPFGSNILTMDDYSTRTFIPGNLERIIVERNLPELTPPGFYTLELTTKPSIMKASPKASITIFVRPSTFVIISFFTVLLLLIDCNILLSSPVLQSPAFRKLALFAHSINIILIALRRLILSVTSISQGVLSPAFRKLALFARSISIGQKFVFLGICILTITSVALALGLERFAINSAIFFYFCLIIGVTNLLWEALRYKITSLNLHPSLRMILSLAMLGLLTYSLNEILATVILASALCMAIQAKSRRLT